MPFETFLGRLKVKVTLDSHEGVCACVCACRHACVCPSGFVWVITPTFMHKFQNYLTQVLVFRRSSVM